MYDVSIQTIAAHEVYKHFLNWSVFNMLMY